MLNTTINTGDWVYADVNGLIISNKALFWTIKVTVRDPRAVLAKTQKYPVRYKRNNTTRS
jgi:regulator of RNase E activity RraA